MKNFLNISDLSLYDISQILDSSTSPNILKNKSIGLIFEKQSTRTRLSFNVGINQLGGNPLDIRFEELSISRNESFKDTFLAMNCYLDGLIYRTNSHKKLIEASNYFDKPIINALSDLSHPCQTISDLLTLKEHFGNLSLNILWVGDMNNVCFSLVEAVNLINDLSLTICCPEIYNKSKSWKLGSNIMVVNEIENLQLDEIDCVMTDVFISMNDINDKEKIKDLIKYQVNDKLMTKTKDSAVFMHCLPAKLGMEVTQEVIESSKSIVWTQAKNRLRAQKKIMQCINW